MDSRSRTTPAKYISIFTIGLTISMGVRAAGATTIETNLSNAIQYIKQVIVTSDGSQGGAIIANIGPTKTFFSGNVGIGTTTPEAKLDVNGIFRVIGLPFSSFTFPSSGQGFEMRFQTDYQTLGGFGGASVFQSYNRNSSAWEDIWIRGRNVIFEANGGGAGLVLISGGNIGIGTSNPTTKLEVISPGTTIIKVGSTSANNPTSVRQEPNGNGTAYYDNATIGSITKIRTSNLTQYDTTALTILANGNLGIKTTPSTYNVEIANPGNNNILQLKSSGIGTSAGVFAQHYDGSHAYFVANNNGGICGVSGFYPFIFTTFNQERMRISGDGNVGIGTTSPTTKLDVNGTINATGYQINGTPGIDKCILYMDQSGIEQYMKYEKGLLIDAGYGTSCP